MQRKIEQSAETAELVQAADKPRELVDGLYLTILSRFPTDEELKVVSGLRPVRQRQERREVAMVDLAWALINSAEFLYRH